MSTFSFRYRILWLFLLILALGVGFAVGAGLLSNAAGLMSLLGTVVLGITLFTAGSRTGLQRHR